MEIKRLEISRLELPENNADTLSTPVLRMKAGSATKLPRLPVPSPHASKSRDKFNEDINTILDN
jgi:hypothetical protein